LIQSEEARAKGAVSSLASQRIQAYERAVRLFPIVEMARRELEAEYHKKFYNKAVSDAAIAKRLNDYRRKKDDSRFAPLGRNDWSGKQVRESLMRAPERIIECAVLDPPQSVLVRQQLAIGGRDWKQTRFITVRPNRSARHVRGRNGSSRSPHNRRGHWRHYRSGKKVWIADCAIHGGSKGVRNYVV